MSAFLKITNFFSSASLCSSFACFLFALCLRPATIRKTRLGKASGGEKALASASSTLSQRRWCWWRRTFGLWTSAVLERFATKEDVEGAVLWFARKHDR